MSDEREPAKQMRDIIERYSNCIHDSTQWFQRDEDGVRKIEPLVAELMAVNVNRDLLAACRMAENVIIGLAPYDPAVSEHVVVVVDIIRAAIARATQQGDGK